MKNYRFLVWILFILVTVVCISCGRVDYNKYAGKYFNSNDYSAYIELKADKTFDWQNASPSVKHVFGTYEIKGNKIIFQAISNIELDIEGNTIKGSIIGERTTISKDPSSNTIWVK